MKVLAHIRNNHTGEVRQYPCEEATAFIWEEGNYSCDCNRELLFGYAKGLKFEDMPDVKCSDGRFSVNLENPVTGEIFYREFE
jgi:hypothetical protein